MLSRLLDEMRRRGRPKASSDMAVRTAAASVLMDGLVKDLHRYRNEIRKAPEKKVFELEQALNGIYTSIADAERALKKILAVHR